MKMEMLMKQFNPNGSLKNIAGIFNKEKNVLGMMPHPERMIDPSLSGEDGSIFFKNLINNLKMIVNEQVAIDHGLKKR